MTVTLKQIAQVSGITAFSNFTISNSGRCYVFNPATPIIIYELGQGSTYPLVGLINGSNAQLISSGLAGLDNSNPSPIWFVNAILTGGAVSTSAGLVPLYVVYNSSNNSINYTNNIQPSSGSPQSFQDIVLDFQNQVAYLFYHSNTFSNAIIYAISFSNLSTLISSLQFPSTYTVAYITATNAPSGFSINGSALVYYNQVFYMNAIDGSGNLYIWVVSYSSISWSSTFPSAPQAVGTLYAFGVGGLPPVVWGEIFLNYIVSGSSLQSEILIYAVANFNSTNRYFQSIAIYSFNLSNNTATLLYSLNNANAKATAINMGGIIVFAQLISGSMGAWTATVGTYDRNLNVYQSSQPFANVQDLSVSQGGYAIVVSGSSSSPTFTIYQILVDTTPAIQNLTYSGGTLTGTVVDSTSGQPLANVTVFLIQLSSEGDNWASGSVIATTTTNTSGGFSFNISQTGYYAVYAVP